MMKKNIKRFFSIALIIPFLASTQMTTVNAAENPATGESQNTEASKDSDLTDSGADSAGAADENKGAEESQDAAGTGAETDHSDAASSVENPESGTDSSIPDAQNGMSAGAKASSGTSEGNVSDSSDSASSGMSDDASAVVNISSEESSGISNLLGASAVVAPQGSFEGIHVDGDFSDWNAVTKEDTSSVSDGLVNAAGMVFDGDYVYLYLDEHQPNAASWSGVNSSGNFAITTDLGNVMIVHVLRNGQVEVKYQDQTVSGVTVSTDYKSGDWHSDDPHYRREIAIPKSALPYYKSAISFGYYLGSTFVSDVSNYDGSGGNTGSSDSGNGNTSGTGDKSAVSIDGDYADWTNYPNQVIQYDTAGTPSGVVDAEGALYTDGSTAYGHVYTSHPEHLSQMGGYEFTEFTVKVNNDYGKTKRVTAYYQNPDGSLNKNGGSMRNLADGTYTFYLFDISGWNVTTDINNISPHDTCYGKMTVTIKNGIDQMEYGFDLATLAKQFGLSENDVGTFGVQFHRLGQEWLNAAGTSTNPWLAITICIIPTAMLFYYRKKKYPWEFEMQGT